MKLSKLKILSVMIVSMLGGNSVLAQAQETKKLTQDPILVSNTILNTSYGDTLEKIKKSGKIYISYRKDFAPISYLIDGKPSGFSFDICNEIAVKIGEKLGTPLSIEYVNSEINNSQSDLINGKIDMECSSNIDNPENRQKVDFSIPSFFSGVKILKTLNSNYYNLYDLKGRKVVINKSDNVALNIIKDINTQNRLNIKIIQEDNDQAIKLVSQSLADAYVSNDLQLYNQQLNSKEFNKYNISGSLMSIEPVAIMIRKNDFKFKESVNKELISMMSSGRFERTYNKWFMSPIEPYGVSLNIIQSEILRDVVRMPIDISGNE